MELQCSWNCFKVALYWRTFKCALKVYEKVCFPVSSMFKYLLGGLGRHVLHLGLSHYEGLFHTEHSVIFCSSGLSFCMRDAH